MKNASVVTQKACHNIDLLTIAKTLSDLSTALVELSSHNICKHLDTRTKVVKTGPGFRPQRTEKHSAFVC